MSTSIRKSELLDLLWENPIEVGHWVGLRDLTDLHNEWLISFLFKEEDQTLQAHRGSYKTTTLSLFFALHAIIYPNETLLYVRKTAPDVMEIARQTANILGSGCMNKMVRILYGKELEFTRLNATEISTNLATSIKGAPQILGVGLGTSITGKHADIVVTDDIVNLNDRVSKAERDKTRLLYQEISKNIKNRGGRMINTGTPWHKDDAFELMPNITKYDCYQTGLIKPDELKNIKSGMSNSLFAANYELRHVAAEDVLFTDPVLDADPILAEQGDSHVDAAFYGEDFTAMTIMAIHDGKFYVFGKCWRKHVDDVMDEIVGWHNQFKTGKMHMELNADKGYVAKQFRSKGVRVGSYNESQNKYVKISSYLKFEWRNVVFVRGTDEKYIEQICDYNEEAAHDDCPDSLASLIRIMGRRKNETANAEQYLYM